MQTLRSAEENRVTAVGSGLARGVGVGELGEALVRRCEARGRRKEGIRRCCSRVVTVGRATGQTEVVAASVVGGPPGKLPSLGSAASGGLRRSARDDLLPLEGAGGEGRRKSVRQVLSACWEEEHPSSLDIQLFDRRRSCEPAHARKIVRIKGTPWLVPRGVHIHFCQAPGKGCWLDSGRAPSQLQPKKKVVVSSLLPIVIEADAAWEPVDAAGEPPWQHRWDLSLRVHLVCEQVKQVVVRELEDHEVREQKFVRWRWQPTGLCLPPMAVGLRKRRGGRGDRFVASAGALQRRWLAVALGGLHEVSCAAVRLCAYLVYCLIGAMFKFVPKSPVVEELETNVSREICK
ncbi:hypothetical protein MLD38_034537 [Melastoma candidum]|uniref:Uncharacterized protein n=1 Tax=Melastoma candidum TaxID=119954 RepID=A0ACB9MA72_9MYRT|nr:hypothetical protein MLD38_034537 [Melastoma candidum]